MGFVPAWTDCYLDSYVEALAEGFHLGNAAERKPDSAVLEAARRDPRRFATAQRDNPPKVVLHDGTVVESPAATVLWWVSEGAFVGAFEIRHSLPNALYAAYGGHFSMGVRRSMRGGANGGHAALMTSPALQAASDLGIGRALVCCRIWNRASQAWTRAAGGIFMDEVPIAYSGQPDVLRRYIVPTPFTGASADAR